MKKSTRGLLAAGLVFLVTGTALGIASLGAGFRYEEFTEAAEQGRFHLIGPKIWARDVQNALSELADEENWLEQFLGEHHDDGPIQPVEEHHEEEQVSSAGEHHGEEPISSVDEYREGEPASSAGEHRDGEEPVRSAGEHHSEEHE